MTTTAAKPANALPPELLKKYKRLQDILTSLRSALVAFSGGVDSTLLLRVAADVLGDRVLAVTAASPVHPETETRDAASLAELLHVRHREVRSAELTDSRFTANDPRRCYWCKRGLFAALQDLAAESGLQAVIEGSNADDCTDYRPGMQALKELAIRSPLLEAGLTKPEIRRLSAWLGLPTGDKPSLACLASRVPYGTPVTPEVLATIEAAEAYLAKLDLHGVRVRHHGPIARIEVSPPDINRFLEEALRLKVLTYFKQLGFTYVSLDLEGYRTGSLNEPLDRT